MRYNPKVVTAFFYSQGIPEPQLEFRFHPERKWRFDFAWPDASIGKWGSENCELRPFALEVQGSIFSGGRHTRGAALVKEYEKLNHAAMLGWRVLFVQPSELCMVETAEMIKRCLNLP